MKEHGTVLPLGKTMKRKKGFFSISAVSKMFAIHQQTIRLYEREGLISPKRSEGNTRLFSDEDVNRLEEIIYLTHKLGINLAGVQMILKMQKQMKKMQREMNKLFEDTDRDMQQEVAVHKQEVQSALQSLKKFEPHKALTEQPLKETSDSPTAPELEQDQWEIDYEE